MVRNTAVLLLSCAAVAAADSVVTHCSRDDEPVTDIDFGKAIAAGGRVTFACPSGTVIQMTRRHPVTRDTRIEGAGAITLEAAGATGMFEVSNASVTLVFSGLTIRKARSPIFGFAGVVTGRATVEISRSTLADNQNAIGLADGTVRIIDSEFTNGSGVAIVAPNVELTRVRLRGNGLSPVQAKGGTVSIRDSDITASGSSVFENCRLRIYNTTWASSVSSAVITGCETTIDLSHFNGNHGASGGALLVRSSAPSIAIRGGAFTGNTADAQGGAIAFESFDGLRPISIRNVTFRGNRAADGGAIHLGGFLENQQRLEGKGLFFVENTAGKSGGAIAGTNVSLRLARAVFAGNRASVSGGGIDLRLFAPRENVIANSLFTRNHAPRGSAFYGSGVRFLNVTIAANEGGTAVSAFWPSSSVNNPPAWRLIHLENTALAGNAPSSCDTTVFGKLIADGGANLQFPAGGCPASIAVGDPRFDSLFTPGWGGAANGKGTVAVCVAQPVAGADLYGRHRPQGKGCSIGAVEGDIEDAILQRHPEWTNLPRNPPGRCPCEDRPPQNRPASAK